MTTDQQTPGAAGIAEAKKRFETPAYAGHTAVGLQEGDPGFDGLAAAERRFTNIYPTQKAV